MAVNIKSRKVLTGICFCFSPGLKVLEVRPQVRAFIRFSAIFEEAYRVFENLPGKNGAGPYSGRKFLKFYFAPGCSLGQGFEPSLA